ncbi:MAG: hypothetical protein WBE11_17865 [Candidatus Aminicenantaceae bacterium]
MIKKAKEWDEGQGKKYRIPKELSSKMYSQKKPVDLSSLTREIKNAVISVGASPHMVELHKLLDGCVQ